MTEAELRAVEEVIARLREGVPLHDIAPGLDPSLVEFATLLAGDLAEVGWGAAPAVPAGFQAVWESVAVLGGVGASGAAVAGGGLAAGGGGSAATVGGAGTATGGTAAAGGGAAAAGAGATAAGGGATGVLGSIAGALGGIGASTTAVVTTAVVASAVVASAVVAGVVIGGDDDLGAPPAAEGSEMVTPGIGDDPDLSDSLWGDGTQDESAAGPAEEADEPAPEDPSTEDGAAPADGAGGPAATAAPDGPGEVPLTPAPAPSDPPPASTTPPDPGPPSSPPDPPDPGPPSSPPAPRDPGPPGGPPGAPDPDPPGDPDPGPPDVPDPDPDPDPDPGPVVPPVARGAEVTIASGDTTRFDILGSQGGEPYVTEGDLPLDPDSLSIVIGPEAGEAQVDDGTIVYTPAPFWLGDEAITYRVCDTTGDEDGCAEAVLEVATTRRVETFAFHLETPEFVFEFAPHRDPETASFQNITVCEESTSASDCLVERQGPNLWRWFGPPGRVPGGYPFVMVVHIDSWAAGDGVDGPTGIRYELHVTLTHRSGGAPA